IAAGIAAGCRTILLDNPDLGRNRPEKRTVTPTFICKTLAEAARIIASEGKSPPIVMQAEPVSPAVPPAAAPQAPAGPMSSLHADSGVQPATIEVGTRGDKPLHGQLVTGRPPAAAPERPAP